MGGGSRLRTAMAGAAVLLSAAGAAVLGAAGASAAPGASAGAATSLSMSVSITSQVPSGSACNWGVTFNVTITNSGKTSATVTSVDAGSYNPLGRNGGLAAGTVLASGTNTFTNLFSGNGTPEGQPCPTEAPDPLVLTVNTSAGSVTWNESVSDPQVVTMMALPQTTSATLAGSFDVADCSKYYFEYGTTTNYGTKVDTSTVNCPNDGTMTELAGFNVTGLQPNTTYHYRFVVMSKMGTVYHGQDVQFTTKGTTQVPIGSIGLIGLTALAGGALFAGQRWRLRRRTAQQ